MDHDLDDIYEERPDDWTVWCSCGWFADGLSSYAAAVAMYDAHHAQVAGDE